MSDASLQRSHSKPYPVLFLHGFCEGSWIWNDIILNLKEKFFCLAPDLPGFGKNKSLPAEVSIDHVAEKVLSELDLSKIENGILVGHSLGGYVALAIAEKNPGTFKGLVLFHSTPFADSDEKKINRERVIKFVSEYGSEKFLDQFVPSLFFDASSGRIGKFRAKASNTPCDSIVYYSAAMRDRPDRTSVIKNSSFPVLIIGGKFDPLIPPDLIRQIADLNPLVEVLFLNNSSHAGMVEESEQSLKILEKFFQKCYKN